MSRYFTLLLLLVSCCLSAQHRYQRINNMRELRLAGPLYDTDADYHTSVRPLDRWRIDSISNIRSWPDTLAYNYPGWIPRKLFNEHLFHFQGDSYELTVDPVVNFRGGFDPSGADDGLYFVNTRGFSIEGRLGEKVTFSTSYLENQARFPSYVLSYPRVVPGQGKRRSFKEDGVDYGLPSGEVTYSPDDIFSFTLGQGRHFFGEGYRSMLLSDAAFNYPFFRAETKFWKIKYVNLWAQMYDLRPQAQVIDAHAKKYLSSHYLSINITNRWNLGFFEAIVVGDTLQQHGPDVAFYNPVIFYRPVEWAVGSEQGNALMGLNTSYKILDGFQVYGQFTLDEFQLEAIRRQEGDWVNKYGWQLGAKNFASLGQGMLFTRAEYNAARPFTYSHRVVLTNYAHYSQPLAHPWGANFHEVLGQAVWQHNRWEVEGRLHLGVIGLDRRRGGISHGADLYRSYNEREGDRGHEIAQGERGDYFYLYVRGAWLVNPTSGLKLEAGLQWRELAPAAEEITEPLRSGSAQYVFVGLRTEFFNRYYDF